MIFIDYMFAKFNYTMWPTVSINLEGPIGGEDDFNLFLFQWENLYERKESFKLIFDVRKFGMPSPYYALKMTVFIEKLRRKYPQYLEKSIIILNSGYIKYLINFMFLIQPPVAPVYTYYVSSIDAVFDSIGPMNAYERLAEDSSKFTYFKPKIPAGHLRRMEEERIANGGLLLADV